MNSLYIYSQVKILNMLQEEEVCGLVSIESDDYKSDIEAWSCSSFCYRSEITSYLHTYLSYLHTYLSIILIYHTIHIAVNRSPHQS